MKNNAYHLELLGILKSAQEEQRESFINRFTSQALNPTVVFGWSIFLGGLGIDRFILGQPLLGILKLITFGGLGIWTIVDWFLVGGAARRWNIAMAREIAASLRAQ